MKTQAFIWILILGILLGACNDENIQISPQTFNFNQYELVWQDEFDSCCLDMNKWNYRSEGNTRGYGIVNRKAIEQNGDGYIHIKVIKDEEYNKYYVGQIGTQGLYETKFGYFECRAKINKSVGPHVAFWLQSPTVNKVGNTKLYGAEIDIFEYHCLNPKTVHHNIHWDGYGKDHKTTGKTIDYPSIITGFHTFGLEWTPYEYIFYVDGKKTWSTKEAISHKEQYIILSTELTGMGGDPSKGVYPDAITIDYVRVYKIKENIN